MKVCIFDLDGTLTDTLEGIAHFANTALIANGLKDFPTERYKLFVGNGRTKLIERILDEQGALTDANFNKVCMDYDAGYEADPIYKTKAYDGIVELLAELKQRGILLCVCSNKPDNVVQDVVDAVFLRDTFEYVYGIKEGMAVKPDPKCAVDIAKKLGADVKDCVFIGDTNIDIHTAKNAGMTSVGVLWGFRDYAELSEAGADYIVKSPSEILGIIDNI